MLLARYQSLVFVYYVHVYVYHDDEQNVYDLLVRLYGSECWAVVYFVILSLLLHVLDRNISC